MRLAWQHEPSIFISIGVVGGVVPGLLPGCLLIVSLSKVWKFAIVYYISLYVEIILLYNFECLFLHYG